MALAAGRVGVNPDQVDSNGRIKNAGGPVDAYTKSETDTLLEAKANQSDLKANGKKFVFAYSGGQYGYKAGTNGTFHPFSVPGWNRPGPLAEGSVENLLISGITGYLGGCYYYPDIIYFDLATVKEITDPSSGELLNIVFESNKPQIGTPFLYSIINHDNADEYIANGVATVDSNYELTINYDPNDWTPHNNMYIHIWGQYIPQN